MARQITYGKVTRTLRLLNLTEPASQNDDVLFGGKKVGHLTSVVETPHNEIVALAIIKTAFLEDGVMSVSVQSNGRILQAELLANK
jgi:folate-binding Fe-S cluster repair protein YgfZ